MLKEKKKDSDQSVYFQDTLGQEDKTPTAQSGVRLREVYQPTRAVIDKKLAILDKALEKNPGCLRLQLAQLELYQDIWDEGKVDIDR